MSSPPTKPAELDMVGQFSQVQPLVAAEFDIEEALIKHGIPTFFVKRRSDSKQAFERLVKSLARVGYLPVLREAEGRDVLKVAPKPETKPSRPIINVILLLATITTVFTTGYFLSLGLEGLNPWVGAGGFTMALLGILGVHEMAHKLAANHHRMEATMPYFIPGPPLFGLGTFGAVILQKETPTNRDALFDIGASGPIAGFVVAIVVSIVGLAMSPVEPMTPEMSGSLLSTSLLFSFLANTIVQTPGPNYVILLHPVAFAGWVGLFITVLNLLPTGMLDGGHTLRSIISSDTARYVFTFLSIGVLVFAQQWVMLAFVLFLSLYKHPGPLDDVSKLSSRRKLVSILLALVFVLCVFLPREIIIEVFRFFGLV